MVILPSMPVPPAYDLMILVDADAPEEARTRVVEDVKSQIAAGEGDLKGDADWGVRRLAYEIDHRTEAYYHLFQLEASSTLLNQLQHSLSIDDQVLRHRVIKLPKGAPERTPRPEPSVTRQAEPSSEQPSAEPAEAEPRPAEAEASPAEAQASPAEDEASPAPAEASPAEDETGPAEAEPGPQPAEQTPS
jgi:small subunit ribosomal protein S6